MFSEGLKLCSLPIVYAVYILNRDSTVQGVPTSSGQEPSKKTQRIQKGEKFRELLFSFFMPQFDEFFESFQFYFHAEAFHPKLAGTPCTGWSTEPEYNPHPVTLIEKYTK